MASAKEVKNHIRSVKDTQKITNAMYLISSTKLRKARADLEATEPYYNALHQEIQRIFDVAEHLSSPYFYEADETERPGTYGYLVVTADKGLAGAYNQNVIREALRQMQAHPDHRLFVVGEYGRQYFKAAGIPVEKSFLYTAQSPSMTRAREISSVLMSLYEKGELTEIHVVYTETPRHQEARAVSLRLLPFHRERFRAEKGSRNTDFQFYPDPAHVLNSIIPGYVSGSVYSVLVESFYSEQNARMNAMDSANTNAEALLNELNMQYHHLRQDAITAEITEVSAGARSRKAAYQHE